MIKISPSVQDLIIKNQRKFWQGVIPPKWGIEGQVRDHFTGKKNTVKRRFEELKKAVFFDKKSKILDLGCGYGFLIVFMRKLGFNIVGCDTDGSSIEVAKKILSENGISPGLAVINGKKLPYRDNSFDLIYLNHVLVYVNNLPDFFKEIKRILKKGGKVYLVTPNYQCCYDINYGIFLIPWLPRWINKIYLRLLGRKESFLDSITFTDKNLLERIFIENGFGFENVGLKKWLEMFEDSEFSYRSRNLKRFFGIMRKFRLKPLAKLLAERGFYTPLIYVLKK